MAKAKPRETPAEIGDNLTEAEEARAMRIYHISKLRTQEIKKLEAKAKYDAECSVLTDLFRLAKADTGYLRKEFQSLLDDMRASRTDLAAAEERRATLRRDVDLPVGFQGDLFATTPQEVQDEAHARGMGYAAGLRGDPCMMPDTMAVRFGQPFSDGWGRGQEELSWALAAVGRVIDRKKNANSNPVALQPEPEEDPDAAIDEAAARLKAEGWAEPTSEEAELEAA